MPANIGAELQALPLEYLIAAPLTAAIKGQALAAMTTADFINNVLLETDPLAASGSGTASARMVSFSYDSTVTDPNDPNNTNVKTILLSVPLMSIVHTPNLRIQDMTIGFEFKIRDVQTIGTLQKFSLGTSTSYEAESKTKIKAGIGGGLGLGGLLSANAGIGGSSAYSQKFKFSATGSATYQRSERHQTDRSATYKFNLNVKEETPEGFLRVLEILNNAITNSAPTPAPPPGP